MKTIKQIEKEAIRRCGVCGIIFRVDGKLIDMEELDGLQNYEYELDYCIDCGSEEIERQNRTVTKDMAIDAGMPELEGQKL